MKNSIKFFIYLTSAVVFVLPGCSDEGPCTPEGATEVGGPQCCAGGCGNSTADWRPRICKKGVWTCQGSKGTIEYACASKEFACTTLKYCGEVGIGKAESDPSPELCCHPHATGKQCCEEKCTATRVFHRTCKTGVLWECPAGTIPISRCKDYDSACNGILGTYRSNGFKLPTK